MRGKSAEYCRVATLLAFLAWALVLAPLRMIAHPVVDASNNSAPSPVAAAPGKSPTSTARSFGLDLSSAQCSVVAGKLRGFQPVTIVVGGQAKNVTPSTMLTPAETVALKQVLNTGQQSIILDSSRTAAGGSFVLNSSLMQRINSLVIPPGVTAVAAFSQSPAFTMSGDLTNAGIFCAVSTNPAISHVIINALNIFNSAGGILSTSFPTAGMCGITPAVPQLSLTLTASNGIVNAGLIDSSAALTLDAGGTLTNTAAGRIQAFNDINLISRVGRFVNSGLISSQAGNLNFSTGQILRNIRLDNAAGTLQAPDGRINIGTPCATDSFNIEVTGGNLLSREVNISSGAGDAILDVGAASGVVNVYANNVSIQTDTPSLRLGDLAVSQDPIIVNSGSIDLSHSAPVRGSEFVVVAGENITSSSPSFDINTSSSNGNGGYVVLAAGAAATVGDYTVTITGRSGRGGDIDLANLTSSKVINTCSTASHGGGGGKVTLVAFSDTPGSSTGGHVFLPRTSTITTAGNGDRMNGDVLVIAEATGTPSRGESIAAGNINTATNDEHGTGSGGGAISLLAQSPDMSYPVVLNGGRAQPGTGAIQSGAFTFGAARGGAISAGDLTTNSDSVTIHAGANPAGANSIDVGNITTIPLGNNISGALTLIAGTTGSGGGSLHAGTINIRGAGEVTMLIVARDSIAVHDLVTGGGPVILTAGCEGVAGDISFHDITSMSVSTTPFSYGGIVSIVSMGSSGNITGSVIRTDSPNNQGPAGAVVISTGGSAATGRITLSRISCRGTGDKAYGGDVLLTTGMNPASPEETIRLTGANPVIDTSGYGSGASPGMPGQIYIVYNRNGGTNASDANTRQDDGNGTRIARPAIVAASQTDLTSDRTIEFTPGSGGSAATVSGFSPGGFVRVSDGAGPLSLTIDTHGDGCTGADCSATLPRYVFVPIVALTGALSLTNPNTKITTRSTIAQSGFSLFAQRGMQIDCQMESEGRPYAMVPIMITTAGSASLSSSTTGTGVAIGAIWSMGTLTVNVHGPINLGQVGPLDSLAEYSMSTLNGTGAINVGSLIVAPSISLSTYGTGGIYGPGEGKAYVLTRKLTLTSAAGDFSPGGLFGTTAIEIQANTTGQCHLATNSPVHLLASSGGTDFHFVSWAGAEVDVEGDITATGGPLTLEAGNLIIPSGKSVTGEGDVTIQAQNITSGTVRSTHGNVSIQSNAPSRSLSVALGTGSLLSAGGSGANLLFNSVTAGAITITGGPANGVLSANNVVSFNGGAGAVYVDVNSISGTVHANGSTVFIVTAGSHPAPANKPSTPAGSAAGSGLLSSLPSGIDSNGVSGTIIATDATPSSHSTGSGRRQLAGHSLHDALASQGEQKGLADGAWFDRSNLAGMVASGIDIYGEPTGHVFTLNRGNVVFAPTRNIVVSAKEGNVHISAGSIVLVMETGADTAVLNLHDTRAGAVTIVAGRKLLTVPMGNQVVLTRRQNADFDKVNPGTRIGYRNILENDIGDGLKAYSAEFSIASALASIKPLREILTADNLQERAAGRQLVKNAASLALVTVSKGAYRTTGDKCSTK